MINHLFREALRTLLTAYPGLDIVGDASNGEEALRMAFTLTPDVVLDGSSHACHGRGGSDKENCQTWKRI